MIEKDGRKYVSAYEFSQILGVSKQCITKAIRNFRLQESIICSKTYPVRRYLIDLEYGIKEWNGYKDWSKVREWKAFQQYS